MILAHTYDDTIDPSGWLMSEKLDGVRAYWDGEHLKSRNGNILSAPHYFTCHFPPIHLDGELWAGRGKFQKAVSIVRRKTEDPDIDPLDYSILSWHNIRYLVFDAPQAQGGFADRIQYLLDRDNRDNFGYWLEPQIVCRDKEHLFQFLEEIQSKGGEGVMLRKADSLYEYKRSRNLLKVKTFIDTEGTVVGYVPGLGKHIGRLGALVVESQGKRFLVGTGFTDAERENPPEIGSIITYKYQSLTDIGIPRFPVYMRPYSTELNSSPYKLEGEI